MKTESSSNSSSSSSSSSALKWNQHPVISTVLWILGTTETSSGTTGQSDQSLAHTSSSSQPSLPHHGSSSSGSLSSFSGGAQRSLSKDNMHILWRDQQAGGSIHEYFSQVQSAPQIQAPQVNILPAASGTTEATTPTDAASQSSGETENTMDLHTRQNTINNTYTNIYSAAGSGGAAASSSSQDQASYVLQPKASTTTHMPPPQVYTRSFHAVETNPYHHNAAGSHPRSANSPGGSAGGIDYSTPSPQWDFYVPITPPQQDMYVATPAGNSIRHTTSHSSPPDHYHR